jgi:hypothetical protein
LSAHHDIRHDRLSQRWIKSKSRPWIERFDLGDHVGDVGGIHAAQADQRGDIAGGQQRQVVEKCLHCWVQPVSVAKL